MHKIKSPKMYKVYSKGTFLFIAITNIPVIFQNAIFGLLLYTLAALKKTPNRGCYYLLFSKQPARKSSRPKPSILKDHGYIAFMLLLISFFIFPSTLQASRSVWDVLRSQFSLNHEIRKPEVQTQLNWFLEHPGFLKNLSQSEPYIYHIVTEIKKRGLPGELALLPMIESAYNPFAHSTVGAAGLWQLMPGTGSNWGLKQDWWFDARRSIPSSTSAALNYLSYLNRYFNGNWILAIAAYDAGEGAVSRSIKSSGQSPANVHFFTLPLPNETKIYVPRLLALAEIIKYPERYRINLPEIPHAPYFEEVNIGSQIDLNQAAKLAGISYKELIKLNPGCNRWTTAPNQPFKLLIPRSKVYDFNKNLASIPTEKRVSWTHHRVQNNENLALIAQRYFTTVKLIRELNQLKSDDLKYGQQILIPSSKNTFVSHLKPGNSIEGADKPKSTETYKVIHIVQPGDTYKVLEKKYNVCTENIQNWNNLNSQQHLNAGTQLIIWKRIIRHGLYTVKKGDTLKSIALLNNTEVKTLIQLNSGINGNQLKIGQRIIIG